MELKHYGILLLAAVLEVGGDAIIRYGLPRWSGGTRLLGATLIALGILVLGAYGIFVNKAPVDFSTTLGLYVSLFALVGCVIGAIHDGGVKWTTVAGIAVIVAGGWIIHLGQRSS